MRIFVAAVIVTLVVLSSADFALAAGKYCAGIEEVVAGLGSPFGLFDLG